MTLIVATTNHPLFHPLHSYEPLRDILNKQIQVSMWRKRFITIPGRELRILDDTLSKLRAG